MHEVDMMNLCWKGLCRSVYSECRVDKRSDLFHCIFRQILQKSHILTDLSILQSREQPFHTAGPVPVSGATKFQCLVRNIFAIAPSPAVACH